MASVTFGQRVLGSLRAFRSDSSIEDLFQQLFDGEEIVPAGARERYEHQLAEDPLLAPLYMVPISGAQIARLRRLGKLARGPDDVWVADVPYDPSWGLDLTAENAASV